MQEIRGTLGLTEEQYTRISGQAPPQQHQAALDVLNHDDADTLVGRFGILALTARLLVVRRPFASVEQIRGTLGLTEEQYAAIKGEL